MNNTLKLVVSILLPVAVGAISGLFTTSEIPGWYQTIQKPSWNPPNWIFGPVWTTLYLLMGIAQYLVWKSNISAPQKNMALLFFAIQLLLNFFWSFIFFKEHQLGWAFAEIIAMWVFILLTIFAFARINNTAAWLLVPYISWVSFAAILNYSIWQLNSR
ncbi:MAG: tryptophan-rich sensory protein [Terrimonas sp.]|nr:tryptophan-rich sensory protein [Terrimonas sp.]